MKKDGGTTKAINSRKSRNETHNPCSFLFFSFLMEEAQNSIFHAV
jgi:hypothetical protein